MTKTEKLGGLLAASTLALVAGCAEAGDNEDTGADPTAGTGTAETMGPDASGSESDSDSDSDADSDSDSDTETGTPDGCADPNDAGARMGVNADFDGDAMLTCDTVWVLETIIFARNGTLTIEPGTTILGTEGSALVVDASASLVAEGSEGAPIVMTSIQAEGSRGRGDWGGLVLIGDAPNNLEGGVGSAEGFADPPSYGGSDAAHNCGSLSYLRVEWAGFAIAEGSELNGITFYSCGSDTSVDHVQVHMGADDGIEMFGGNFNAKYVVITGAEDDSLDCDQGYAGQLQHVFIQQDPSIGDNVFEWSNQGTDFTATPLTSPSVANVTAIGSGSGGEKSKGLTMKEGAEVNIYSSIMGNFTNELMFIQNLETQTAAEGGGSEIAGNVFFSHGGFAVDEKGDVAWAAADFEAWVMGSGNVEGDPGMASTTWGSPDPMPSALASENAATPSGGFWDATDYAGAVEPGGDNWPLAGWTNYGV